MQSKTTVINVKDKEAVKEAQDQGNYVYVGRHSDPSIGKWGNPFTHESSYLAAILVSTREEAVERYRNYIIQRSDLMAALPELRGKVLGCWCAPKPCHAYILAELADKFDPDWKEETEVDERARWRHK
jgi:hypothetical protein